MTVSMTQLWDDIIQTQFRANMSEVYTAIPCVVINVHGDFSEQRVDVQPSINDLYKDKTFKEQVPILSVPVLLPGGRNSLVSFPIKNGDTVMCIFSQRSMDQFKIGNGLPTTPNDHRQFSDEDAVAIPGLFPFSRTVNRPMIRKYPHDPSNDLVIAHNIGSGTEVMIQMKANGELIINTEEGVTVNSKTANVNATQSVNVTAPSGVFDIDSSTWTGNMAITGSWTFNGIPFNTHKHTGVTPGGGTSGTPTA